MTRFQHADFYVCHCFHQGHDAAHTHASNVSMKQADVSAFVAIWASVKSVRSKRLYLCVPYTYRYWYRHTNMNTCTYTYMHLHVFTHVSARVYTSTFIVHNNTCVFAHTCLCMYNIHLSALALSCRAEPTGTLPVGALQPALGAAQRPQPHSRTAAVLSDVRWMTTTAACSALFLTSWKAAGHMQPSSGEAPLHVPGNSMLSFLPSLFFNLCCFYSFLLLFRSAFCLVTLLLFLLACSQVHAGCFCSGTCLLAARVGKFE